MTELKKSGATASAPPGVQSIHRALSVLELIAASDAAVGVTVIANSTGLAPATAHRLLRTLQARGYVQHVDERKYALGAAALRLGASAQRSVATGARPRLAQLVAATGETANLAVLEGDDVRSGRVATETPFSWSSAGR